MVTRQAALIAFSIAFSETEATQTRFIFMSAMARQHLALIIGHFSCKGRVNYSDSQVALNCSRGQIIHGTVKVGQQQRVRDLAVAPIVHFTYLTGHARRRLSHRSSPVLGITVTPNKAMGPSIKGRAS